MRAASTSPGNVNVHGRRKREVDDIDLDIFRGTTRVVLDGNSKARDQQDPEASSLANELGHHDPHQQPSLPPMNPVDAPSMQHNQHIYQDAGANWPPALPRLHSDLAAQGQPSGVFGVGLPVGGTGNETRFANAYDTYDVAATDMSQLFNDFEVQLPQMSPTNNAGLWDEIWREMDVNRNQRS